MLQCIHISCRLIVRFIFVILQSQVVSGDFGRVLPMCIFGILAILAGLLSILLPETNKRELPETLEDAVNFIQ